MTHVRWEKPEQDLHPHYTPPVDCAYVGDVRVGDIHVEGKFWYCYYLLRKDGFEIHRIKAENLPSEEVTRTIVEQAANLIVDFLSKNIPTP